MMTVEELIEKLKQFDLKETIYRYDGEYGRQCIESVSYMQWYVSDGLKYETVTSLTIE